QIVQLQYMLVTATITTPFRSSTTNQPADNTEDDKHTAQTEHDRKDSQTHEPATGHSSRATPQTHDAGTPRRTGTRPHRPTWKPTARPQGHETTDATTP